MLTSKNITGRKLLSPAECSWLTVSARLTSQASLFEESTLRSDRKKPFSLPISVRAGACERKAHTFKSSVAGTFLWTCRPRPRPNCLLLGWTKRSVSGKAKCMVRLKEEGQVWSLSALTLALVLGIRGPCSFCVRRGVGGVSFMGSPRCFQEEEGRTQTLFLHLLFQVPLAQNNRYAEV